VNRLTILSEQDNLEHLTRSTRASERAKRASINENVEKNESYQIDRRQKLLRVVHHSQTKNRVAQQSRDLWQAFSESSMKRSRRTFNFERQDSILRDVSVRFYQAINDLCTSCQIKHV
jgi:hypothetical protein